MPILAFPAEARALPTPADLQRLLALPLTQLVVCGRSGSMFLHALLDGHPEILQIPHTLKFYDFLAANPDFGRLDGSALARAFAEFPAHQPLFDSDTSVLLKGRLGPELDTRVVVDKQAFVSAMAGLLPGNGRTGQQILCAVLLAHAWCAGIPVTQVRHLFLHVHHGDWLWPDAVEDDSNLQGLGRAGGLHWLAPRRLIVMARNPVEQILGLQRFVTKAVADPSGQAVWMERYLRLLAQDWLRIELAQASGLDVRIVRLEDMRADIHGEVARLCDWMGVTAGLPQVMSPTIWSLPWWGDTYSAPSLTMNPPEPIASPTWKNADHQFLLSAARHVVTRQGYPTIAAHPWTSRLVRWTARKPSRPWPVTAEAWADDLRRRTGFLARLRTRHASAMAAMPPPHI